MHSTVSLSGTREPLHHDTKSTAILAHEYQTSGGFWQRVVWGMEQQSQGLQNTNSAKLLFAI